MLPIFPMSDTINDNNISQLASCIVANDPMHRRFLDKSLSVLCPKDRLDLSAYIGWWEKSGRDIEWLASGYNLFVRETVVEQIRFKRERCYRFSTYSEVAAAGYTAPEYMEPYMVGLALSLFFWPNHVALKDFHAEWVRSCSPGGRYLEVGPGHGLLFAEAMRANVFSTCFGVDVNSKSAQMTLDILASGVYGAFSNYQVEVADFLTWDSPEKADVVVLGEVVEHVERPLEFLKKAAEITNPNGRLFVSTCINAPEIDHIYLYRSVEEVEDQLVGAGLQIERKLVLPHGTSSLELSLEKCLPVNLAYWLRTPQ